MSCNPHNYSFPYKSFRLGVYIKVFFMTFYFTVFQPPPNPQLLVYIMDHICCVYCQFPWYYVCLVCQESYQNKLPPKIRISSSFPFFVWCVQKIFPMVSIIFCGDERLEWVTDEIKAYLGYYSTFIEVKHRKNTRRYDVEIFFSQLYRLLFSVQKYHSFWLQQVFWWKYFIAHFIYTMHYMLGLVK